MDAHSAMVMAQGFTQDQVQSILENIDGSPLIDDKTKLILHFSETITCNSYKIHEGTLQDLRDHGCPVAMSGNVGILDMKTALMTVGAPEYNLAIAAQAEVARSFNLPTWGLAGATDSKTLDAQADHRRCGAWR